MSHLRTHFAQHALPVFAAAGGIVSFAKAGMAGLRPSTFEATVYTIAVHH